MIKQGFIKIAGVDHDSRLRVRSEGNAGRKGGPSGDLYVFIKVKRHPSLKRDGTTIHADAKISYVDAILGTTVQVSLQLICHPCMQELCLRSWLDNSYRIKDFSKLRAPVSFA